MVVPLLVGVVSISATVLVLLLLLLLLLLLVLLVLLLLLLLPHVERQLPSNAKAGCVSPS